MVRKLKPKQAEVEKVVDEEAVAIKSDKKEKAAETRYTTPKRGQKAPPAKQIRKTQGK